MSIDGQQLAAYAAAVHAVPGVGDVVAVDVESGWQLCCRQPLSKQALALIELVGSIAPEAPVLVATTAFADVDYVTTQLFSTGVLFAETVGWQPGTPLNPTPFTVDRHPWTAWPVVWPLETIGAQLTAMAGTLHALVQIYAQVVVDLQAAGHHTPAEDAATVIAKLVGTAELADANRLT